MNGPAGRRRGPVDAGFTLIELLVVIVIIAILTSLVTVGVNAALNSSRHSSSEAMLGTIAGALETYRTRWGDYPPTSIDEIGGRSPNDLNTGGEALVACLSSTRKGGIVYQPSEEHYGNVDKDKASTNVTGWFFGDNELREFRDFFGNVITYVHGKDYAKPKSGVLKYKFADGGPEYTIAPEQSPVTKAFLNPGKFQLRTPGRDGKPGTGDDIR
jgi:prepilin-type N-terminal cleavage/methylation domain-containing protein